MAVKRRTASKPKKPKRSGLGSVEKRQAQQQNRRKRDKAAWVDLSEERIVRAVDTKTLFKDAFVHPVEFERRDGSTYTMDVLCLDQDEEGDPCPGCRDDLERRFKFWMVVIERDAEKMNASGKVIGHEDQLRLLSGANRLVAALNAKHKRKDLAKQDIIIARSGKGFDTQYEVEWDDDSEPGPLSKADKALVDEDEKVIEAFERFTTAPEDPDSFYDPPSGGDDDEDDEDVGSKSKRRGSVFDKKRKASASKSRTRDEDDEDDEDDDDDEEETPRRRSSKKPSGLAAKAQASKSGGTKRRLKTRRS